MWISNRFNSEVAKWLCFQTTDMLLRNSGGGKVDVGTSWLWWWWCGITMAGVAGGIEGFEMMKIWWLVLFFMESIYVKVGEKKLFVINNKIVQVKFWKTLGTIIHFSLILESLIFPIWSIHWWLEVVDHTSNYSYFSFVVANCNVLCSLDDVEPKDYNLKIYEDLKSVFTNWSYVYYKSIAWTILLLAKHMRLTHIWPYSLYF